MFRSDHSSGIRVINLRLLACYGLLGFLNTETRQATKQFFGFNPFDFRLNKRKGVLWFLVRADVHLMRCAR